MAEPVLYIRDDDVFTLDPVFKELFDFFVSLDLKVVYGVIPAKMDRKFIDQVWRWKKKYPGHFDIAQHGCYHHDYSESVSDKYEFGPKRSYAQQFKDVKDGARRLDKAFGQHFVPVFLPPFDYFDINTLKAVEALGIPAFSSGEVPQLSPRRFLWLPVNFMMNDFADDGTPLSLGTSKMLPRLIRLLQTTPFTGIVFHHDAIKTQDEMQHVKQFFKALALLRDQKKIKLVLLSDILKIKGLPVSFQEIKQ